ncbi:hypothetical protein CEXT_714911 [Caerostris extrusa]|uniref:Uncharacterized protein n=1 Tax=Caerostris extrusa TaxID=172846 RepID=A0AAV4N1S8_CAEEX|nr:hypothetical protein CEXT_714911 [Caerostris extrusa]
MKQLSSLGARRHFFRNPEGRCGLSGGLMDEGMPPAQPCFLLLSSQNPLTIFEINLTHKTRALNRSSDNHENLFPFPFIHLHTQTVVFSDTIGRRAISSNFSCSTHDLLSKSHTPV